LPGRGALRRAAAQPQDAARSDLLPGALAGPRIGGGLVGADGASRALPRARRRVRGGRAAATQVAAGPATGSWSSSAGGADPPGTGIAGPAPAGSSAGLGRGGAGAGGPDGAGCCHPLLVAGRRLAARPRPPPQLHGPVHPRRRVPVSVSGLHGRRRLSPGCSLVWLAQGRQCAHPLSYLSRTLNGTTVRVCSTARAGPSEPERWTDLVNQFCFLPEAGGKLSHCYGPWGAGCHSRPVPSQSRSQTRIMKTRSAAT
jgi:hypothetical protein